jgi:5'(3')-deoxyribonucleotidase
MINSILAQIRPGQKPIPLGGGRATLSLDLDNTLRDQIGSIIVHTQRRYGTVLTRDMFNMWDPKVGQAIGIANDVFTAWAWTERQIFADARPFPGVAWALHQLSSRYRLLITTSTACPDLTEPWLNRWRLPFDAIIHTADKGSVDFDLHIDDSPHTLLTLAGQGRRVIRYDLPWNRALVQLPVLKSWLNATKRPCPALPTEPGTARKLTHSHPERSNHE